MHTYEHIINADVDQWKENFNKNTICIIIMLADSYDVSFRCGGLKSAKRTYIKNATWNLWSLYQVDKMNMDKSHPTK